MAPKSILIVDPDAALGELMVRILAEEDYRVVTRQSIDEIEEALVQHSFDLVIAEAFDQKDQFEFDPGYLDDLRSLVGDTPIILCSTYPSTDVLRAGDFGLAGVVAKPFTIDQLLHAVNSVLGGTSASHHYQQGPA